MMICTKCKRTNYNINDTDTDNANDNVNDNANDKNTSGSPLYSLDSTGTLHLDIIPGVLKLSSKRVNTTSTKGYIMKEFEPAFGYLPTFMVKTNKIRDFI